jgi:hypothetical protein
VFGPEEVGVILDGVFDFRVDVQLLNEEFDSGLVTFLDGIDAV